MHGFHHRCSGGCACLAEAREGGSAALVAAGDGYTFPQLSNRSRNFSDVRRLNLI
jgi:hypothetical protein